MRLNPRKRLLAVSLVLCSILGTAALSSQAAEAAPASVCGSNYSFVNQMSGLDYRDGNKDSWHSTGSDIGARGQIFIRNDLKRWCLVAFRQTPIDGSGFNRVNACVYDNDGKRCRTAWANGSYAKVYIYAGTRKSTRNCFSGQSTADVTNHNGESYEWKDNKANSNDTMYRARKFSLAGDFCFSLD